MKILYLGDVMGEPGRKVVSKLLPKIKIQHDIDAVIAQSENVTHGKGLSTNHCRELQEAGVNGFSGGNHTFERLDNMRMASDVNEPVLAPANVIGPAHDSFKLIKVNDGYVAFVSLMGYIAPKGYNHETTESPLIAIDRILPKINENKPTAIIVNIHSEFSSEKVILGHYLDGKVTAVVGDHWHVPTADARVLPDGTAHISDVGMCGALNSSIGVDLNVAIERWKGGKIRNRLDSSPPWQLCGVIIEVNTKNGLAKSIKQLIINTHTL